MEDWREMGSLKVAGFNEVRIDCPRKNRLVETPNGFGFFRLPLGGLETACVAWATHPTMQATLAFCVR